MSSEKRVVVFTLVTFASILAIQFLMDVTGLTPPAEEPPPAGAVAKGKDQDKGKAKDDAKAKGAPGVAKPEVAAKEAKPGDKEPEKAAAKAPTVPVLKPEELVLGTDQRRNKAGYRLRVALDQKGAGVASVTAADYDAEYESNKPRNRPLPLLKYDPLAIPSLAMTLRSAKPSGAAPETAAAEDAAAGVLTAGRGEYPLDQELWEVVREGDQPAVRTVRGNKDAGEPAAEGQEIAFRTTVDPLGVTVTKAFRLFPGEDAFHVSLTFSSPEKTESVVYRLLGPHGIPIEGEWYTGTFRDAVIGQLQPNGATNVATIAASEVVKNRANPQRLSNLPMKYAGVENQYFTTFLAPTPAPKTDADRWDAETVPVVVHDDPEAHQKADVSVEVLSRPVPVGPNAPKTHNYRVYAGPKTTEALAGFGAEDLASYRKSWIPGAPYIAQHIITPLLGVTYGATRAVSRTFGGENGNYGLAIILMTLLVRLAMFPLGRKQAVAAKKMQDLQPLLKEIQEKYKEDKEAQTRETFALYRRHGVNPVGGCLPALVQLPIFVGLWQALNSEVRLRHAAFLWIENLAAPDMLFRFPVELPFLGNYFNILPFAVVGLMLVQTKLFSPPATNPEQEMQQKMMKYMMVFMGFMFYKVPSGLGLYFITSSTWQICERLLLPKSATAAPAAATGDDGKSGPPGGGGGGGGGKGGPAPTPERPPGRFAQFWEKVLAEAAKDPTYRKIVDEREGREGRERDGGDNKGRPRTKPGRRR